MDSQPQEDAEGDTGFFEYINHIITSGLRLIIFHYELIINL